MKTCNDIHCMKWPYLEFFWSIFSCIRTAFRECGVKSVWIWENADQKKFEYGHFSLSVSSGSEPVSMWVPLWDIYTKSRDFFTIKKIQIIISIDLITALGSVGCYILLPAFKAESRVKRQLFWQAVNDVRIRLTPAWCGWVGISV